MYAASKQQTCEREPSIVGRGMKILSSTPEGVFALFFACLHAAICFCFAPFGFNDYFHDGLQLVCGDDIVERATPSRTHSQYMVSASPPRSGSQGIGEAHIC